MRIRNGADFLEATIRSHIAYLDEIVAVYNQCTDATAEILARLAQEFGLKLRVFHYLPRVFPPGSEGHKREPPDSPHSLVNYYNYALVQTRYRVATKLDDDHLAIEPALAELTRRVRSGAYRDDEMACFSGLNLARDTSGRIGIYAAEPFSGSGDIGFFTVSPMSCFGHDRRFERFRHSHLRRRFGGLVYWHVKYLKTDRGFANYEIDENPQSRYARMKRNFPDDPRLVTPAELPGLARWSDRIGIAMRAFGLPLPEKVALRLDRWIAARNLAGRAEIPGI